MEEEMMVSAPQWGGVAVYGIIADSMVVLPILFYMLLDS
jgi:hypothetical protein